MAERLDKRRRKEMLDQWRTQQRAAAREKLPMSDDLMKAMFDMLDAELELHGCDHSRQLVRRWLVENSLPVERVERWLDENGGYCDCEVRFNCKQNWQEAINDVDW